MTVRCQYRDGPRPCMNLAVDGRNLPMPLGGSVIVVYCDWHRPLVEAWAAKLRADALIVDPSAVFADDEH